MSRALFPGILGWFLGWDPAGGGGWESWASKPCPGAAQGALLPGIRALLRLMGLPRWQEEQLGWLWQRRVPSNR